MDSSAMINQILIGIESFTILFTFIFLVKKIHKYSIREMLLNSFIKPKNKKFYSHNQGI